MENDTKNTPKNGASHSFPDAKARVLTPHHGNSPRHEYYHTQAKINQPIFNLHYINLTKSRATFFIPLVLKAIVRIAPLSSITTPAPSSL